MSIKNPFFELLIFKKGAKNKNKEDYCEYFNRKQLLPKPQSNIQLI